MIDKSPIADLTDEMLEEALKEPGSAFTLEWVKGNTDEKLVLIIQHFETGGYGASLLSGFNIEELDLLYETNCCDDYTAAMVKIFSALLVIQTNMAVGGGPVPSMS